MTAAVTEVVTRNMAVVTALGLSRSVLTTYGGFTRSCVCLSMDVFVRVSLYSDLINFHVCARVYFSCEDASIYQFVELHVCA